jgi:hypothetical protein
MRRWPANIMFRLLDTLNVPPLDASLRSTASRSRFGIVKNGRLLVVEPKLTGRLTRGPGKCGAKDINDSGD